jgi:hypothetical protein
LVVHVSRDLLRRESTADMPRVVALP